MLKGIFKTDKEEYVIWMNNRDGYIITSYSEFMGNIHSLDGFIDCGKYYKGDLFYDNCEKYCNNNDGNIIIHKHYYCYE